MTKTARELFNMFTAQAQHNNSQHPTLSAAISEPSPIGRRIRFLEPSHITQYWIQNEIRLLGQAEWHPTYGMTGTIVDMPALGTVGGGPRVCWDQRYEDAYRVEGNASPPADRTSWLGSVSQYEFIDQ